MTQTATLPAPTRGTDAAITVSGVHRTYGDFEAVRGIDLMVGRGELFALLGTNGAGKTSTVELIQGLAAPSQGEIRVLGHDPVADRRLVRPSLGVVLQSSGFPNALTVREMARLWHGTLSHHRPVGDVLDAVHLAHRADIETAKLSGGERRRLDIALALMGDPEVLILDEPTTGLDPESRRTMWGLVTDLVRNGAAVMLTTHHLEEAEQLADRIAIMHTGVIAREGTRAQIVADTPARITFARPTGLSLADLTLPGARVTAGEGVLIETPTLQDTLRAVLDWAGSTPLPELDARSASLEQVFLSIADTQEL